MTEIVNLTLFHCKIDCYFTHTYHKSGIFNRGFATRGCSFGEIKIDLTLKKSNILCTIE